MFHLGVGLVVHQAAQVMDHPADLINVAIEELVRQRFELPAFSTLDTLATHVRAVVHRRLFGTVLGRLSDRQRHELDELLETGQLGRSAFNALKRAPKQPSLSHLDDLVGHVRWLQELGDPADLLGGVPPVKVRHFAAEAGSLSEARIEHIRGTNSDSAVDTLLVRGLIEFDRHHLLVTTRAFLDFASLRDLADLPALPDVDTVSLRRELLDVGGVIY